MTSLTQYQAAEGELPEQTLAWNMYGAGLENIGREDAPEAFEIPKPNADQMLVRVDSVGMCFSDVKLIRQGRKHPKLYNRDLTQEPTRLGHEACITVIEVGDELAGQFSAGDRLAVQPDIYQNGNSTAYGYTIPGGLIQYHLMGKEMLETDAGVCLLPLDDSLGYAETALLEPWGCVMAAYTQRRRLTPKEGGTLWIRGRVDDARAYQFSQYLDRPGTVVVSNIPPAIEAMLAGSAANIVVRDDVSDFAALSAEMTDGKGFDDIVLLGETSAEMIGNIATHIARRGTLNLVGTEPIDGLVQSDVGRLHYDYIAFVGTNGLDIAASYGEARNRCELAHQGSAVVIGAGGPMGQMHVQRAIELPDGPRLVIATEINDNRLEAIQERFSGLAAQNGRTLLTFNPLTSEESLHDFVMRATDGKGVDDSIVCVPVAKLMEEAATLMNENGMLVLFAGVPNGTLSPLELSNVYLNNTQLTGTSGLTIHDQAEVMARTLDGSLSPSLSVAAIGGIDVAKDGLQAMMDGRFPGKIVIFPQITGLPLLGLEEVAAHYPEIAAHLGPNASWTAAAEKALIEAFV